MKTYDYKEKDGSSKRDKLLQVEKTIGICPQELLDEPEVPAAGEHLWELFLKLNSTRQSGMDANPLLCSEIKAYCGLIGFELRSYEVDILHAMDSVFLSTKPDE